MISCLEAQSSCGEETHSKYRGNNSKLPSMLSARSHPCAFAGAALCLEGCPSGPCMWFSLCLTFSTCELLEGRK